MAPAHSPWERIVKQVHAFQMQNPERNLAEFGERCYRLPNRPILQPEPELVIATQAACGEIKPERDPFVAELILLEKWLGEGGSGIVYRGRLKSTGVVV